MQTQLMSKCVRICVFVFLAKAVVAADPPVRPALTFQQTFGGHSVDTGTAIATDASGNVYVTGITTSPDFPIKNGFQRQIGIPVRSTADQGKTWQNPAIPAPVNAVASSAKAPSVLFAGTSQGMYKSIDTGKTWSALSLDANLQVYAVVADPATPSIVYAGTSGGTYKTTDAGATWRPVDPNKNILILVANPNRPGTLFSGIGVDGSTDGPTLYRSTDAGATWSLLSHSPGLVFALACDATNPDVLYAAAGYNPRSIYKTSDAGNSWTKLADLPVVNSTFALAASADTIYAATDNGVAISRDGGATWNATSVTRLADNVAVDPNNPKVAYANAGGIFLTTDSGATWSEVFPVRSNVQTISIVSSPSIVFVGSAPGAIPFVTKWSADGKQMVYSTYLGGSYYDTPTGIAVDRDGNAYVTGYAYSTDFPVTAGAIQSKNSALTSTAFFAKIAPDGSKLLYSTYLGGSTGDGAFAIAVDNSGDAYLTGFAGSDDFLTAGASQPRLDQGCPLPPTPPGTTEKGPQFGDAFVVRIDASAGALRYATYLGGSCADKGLGIAVDSTGNAYVVGATDSTDFPIIRGALNPTYGGGANMGFLIKLTPQGARAYSTFIGGHGNDVANAVSLDDKGNIFITGSTFGFDQVLFGNSGLLASAAFPNVLFSLPSPGFFAATGGAAYALGIDGVSMSPKFVQYLGAQNGSGKAISADSSGKIWVAGSTLATSSPSLTPFPLLHPFQAETGTGFVSELSSDGSTLLFSSLIDSATGLALDSSGNAFVAGTSNQSAFNKFFNSSPLLVRIDSAVPSPVTIEEPQRLPRQVKGVFQPPFPGIAAGEIVVVNGTGLGPQQQVDAQFTAGGAFATSLGGTSVTFDGVPAPLLSVQAQKVVCIAPFKRANTAIANTTVQVTSNGAASNAVRLPVVNTAVEILAVVNADGALNSQSHPAAPGSIMTVYAAGLGRTSPASTDGRINGSGTLLAAPIFVRVEATDTKVLYAGPAPGQVAGISQINFVVPNKPGTFTLYVTPDQGPIPFDYSAASISIAK
jgi:uncharacterized protein (TIGR03437 family)